MKAVLNLGTAYVNAYLVEIEGGWVLVDTGYPFDYGHFIRSAKRLGVALSSIRYVVLTHVHADHAGFLDRILADTGATLICLPAERDRLLSGVNVKDVYISRRILLPINRLSAASRRFQTFEPVDASGAIDPETQPLASEGITFCTLHGHTDNDLCLRVEDKIFVGDVCMNGIGSTGHSPLWIEDNERLVESWRRIVASDAVYLYPGHGKPFPKSDLAKFVGKQAKRKLCKLYD